MNNIKVLAFNAFGQNYTKNNSCKVSNNTYKLPNYNKSSMVSDEFVPSFKSSKPQLDNISFIFIDEQVDPRITVEILKADNFETKPGITAITEITLKDQLYTGFQKFNIKDEGSVLNEYKQKLDLSCKQNDLIDVLKVINEAFVSNKTDKNIFTNAKELAPVVLKLNQLSIEQDYDFNDVPKGISEKDYKEMIDDISSKDVEDYQEKFLNNSNINVTLTVNKTFYKQNSQKIMSSMNNIIEKQG